MSGESILRQGPDRRRGHRMPQPREVPPFLRAIAAHRPGHPEHEDDAPTRAEDLESAMALPPEPMPNFEQVAWPLGMPMHRDAAVDVEEAEPCFAHLSVPPSINHVAQPELQSLFAMAARSMAKRHYDQGLRLQREARNLAQLIGEEEPHRLAQLVLGGYLLEAGQLEGAGLVYERAVSLSYEHDALHHAALGQVGLAGVSALNGDISAAAYYYERAAWCAAATEHQLLAQDAFRVAGQLRLTQDELPEALSCLEHGLSLDTMTETPEVLSALPRRKQLKRIAVAAHTLAQRARARGQLGQAYALASQLTNLLEERDGGALPDVSQPLGTLATPHRTGVTSIEALLNRGSSPSKTA